MGKGGFGQIRIQGHDILIFRPASTSTRPKAWRVANPSFSSNFALVSIYANSIKAFSISSSVGAVPWNFGLFSLNETPLPFIVWAMIAVGFPFVAAASWNAACKAGVLRPSSSYRRRTWRPPRFVLPGFRRRLIQCSSGKGVHPVWLPAPCRFRWRVLGPASRSTPPEPE
jgi:hypothetical protein